MLSSACQSKPQAIIEAPKISCLEMVIEQGSKFNYEDFCKVEGNPTVSEIDTDKVGKQTLKIITEKDGSITTADFTVTVNKKKVECKENEHLLEDEETCECNEGYEKGEDGACALIPEAPEEKPKETEKPSKPTNNTSPPQNNNQSNYTPPQQTYQEPVVEQHGSEYFMPSTYGGFDEAFEACKSRCLSMAGACACDATPSGDGYVLTY